MGLLFCSIYFQSKFEALLAEVDYCRNDLINCMNNLNEWVKPEKVCQLSRSTSFRYVYSLPTG